MVGVKKSCTRAILVGVSLYYSGDNIFTRYFDCNTGCEVKHEVPKEFDLCIAMPWLDTGDVTEDCIIRIKCRPEMGMGKKFMRFKQDLVYAVKNGEVPAHYLVEVFRDSKRSNAFSLADRVHIAAHFVIL